MGILISCCTGSSATSPESALIQPDLETKRRQQAEAAERRLRETDNRGIKNPSKLKEKQRRLEELEAKQDEAARQGNTGGGLKWTVG